jgi:hypothetical protein
MIQRHRRAIIWMGVILAWGLVLLVDSLQNLPNGSAVRYEDVYAELSPADKAKVYPQSEWVPPSRRSASTFITLQSDPTSSLLLREGASEGQTVAAHFDEIRQRKISEALLRFGLVSLALWAASTALFSAFGWLLVVIRRWARPEQWHPGQLVLAWLGASALEFALFVGIRSSLGSVPAMLGIVPLIGTPVGMFVFTWIWFGSRSPNA